MTTVHVEILNRWTRKAQFSCDLESIAGESPGQTLGRAVVEAHKRDAVLTDAVLTRADLTDAVLTRAVLTGADLTCADLTGAVLTGADLTGADLTCADLTCADLTGADLTCADLTCADLTGAVLTGADWMPKIHGIHKSVYAAASAPDALDMRIWHNSCGTSHCRAGWVVTLAGAGGRVLEGIYGTAVAAALIYQASDPSLARVPDFYCTNAEALADMKRLAEQEGA